MDDNNNNHITNDNATSTNSSSPTTSSIANTVVESLQLLRSDSHILNNRNESLFTSTSDYNNIFRNNSGLFLPPYNLNNVNNNNNSSLPPLPPLNYNIAQSSVENDITTDNDHGNNFDVLFNDINYNEDEDDEYIPNNIHLFDDSDNDDLIHSNNKTNNDETVAYRTRARQPLTQYTLDELEQQLQDVLESAEKRHYNRQQQQNDNIDQTIDNDENSNQQQQIELSDEYIQLVDMLKHGVDDNNNHNSTQNNNDSILTNFDDSESEDEIFVPNEHSSHSDNSNSNSNNNSDDDDEYDDNNISLRISKKELRDLRRDKATLALRLNNNNNNNVQLQNGVMPTRRMLQAQQQSNNNALSMQSTTTTGNTPVRRSRRQAASNYNTPQIPPLNYDNNNITQRTLFTEINNNNTLLQTTPSAVLDRSNSTTTQNTPINDNNNNRVVSLLQRKTQTPKRKDITIASALNIDTNIQQSTTPLPAIIPPSQPVYKSNNTQQQNTINDNTQHQLQLSHSAFTPAQLERLKSQFRDHIQLLMQTRVLAQAAKHITTSYQKQSYMDDTIFAATTALNELDIRYKLSQYKYAKYNINDQQSVIHNNLLTFWRHTHQQEKQRLANNNADTSTNNNQNNNTNQSNNNTTNNTSSDASTTTQQQSIDNNNNINADENRDITTIYNEWWDSYSSRENMNISLCYNGQYKDNRSIWVNAEDLLLAFGLQKFGFKPYTLNQHLDTSVDWFGIQHRYLPSFTIQQIKNRVKTLSNKQHDNPVNRILHTTKKPQLTMTAHEISLLRLGVAQFTQNNNVISWSRIRRAYLPQWNNIQLRVMYNKLFVTNNNKAKEQRLRRRMKNAGIDISRANKHKFQQYKQYLIDNGFYKGNSNDNENNDNNDSVNIGTTDTQLIDDSFDHDVISETSSVYSKNQRDIHTHNNNNNDNDDDNSETMLQNELIDDMSSDEINSSYDDCNDIDMNQQDKENNVLTVGMNVNNINNNHNNNSINNIDAIHDTDDFDHDVIDDTASVAVTETQTLNDSMSTASFHNHNHNNNTSTLTSALQQHIRWRDVIEEHKDVIKERLPVYKKHKTNNQAHNNTDSNNSNNNNNITDSSNTMNDSDNNNRHDIDNNYNVQSIVDHSDNNRVDSTISNYNAIRQSNVLNAAIAVSQ